MPPRWVLGAGVLALWLGAMGWRLERDLLPRWREAAQVSYRTSLQGRLPWRERFQLSAQGRPVGTLASEATREPDGTIALRERTVLDAKALESLWPLLSLLGAKLDLESGKPITLNLKLTLSPEYRLAGFDLRAGIGSLPVQGHGKMGADGMAASFRVGELGRGTSRSFLLPMDPAKPLVLGLSPLGVVPDLPVGSGWNIQILNPLTMTPQTFRARVAALEDLEVEGRKKTVRRIEVQHALGQATVWIDAEGAVLKESSMGFEAVRVADEGALPGEELR